MALSGSSPRSRRKISELLRGRFEIHSFEAKVECISRCNAAEDLLQGEFADQMELRNGSRAHVPVDRNMIVLSEYSTTFAWLGAQVDVIGSRDFTLATEPIITEKSSDGRF